MAGLLGSLSLPIALPLATASLAYLNGKYGLTADFHVLSALISSGIRMRLRLRRDRMSMFYDLEDRANNKKEADHPFLVFSGKTWTYKESYMCVLRYARWLKEDMGVKKDDIVALDFTNGDTMIFLMFALWNLGARPALINYNLTGIPLLHSVKASTARLIIVDPEVQEKLTEEVRQNFSNESFRDDGGSVKVVILDRATEDQILSSAEGWRDPDEVRAGATQADMAMLIYTSGTTGLPKPAVVSWHKIGMGSLFTASMLPAYKTDIIYTCMPLYHSSASVMAMGAALQTGATLSLGKRFSVRTFWSEVQSSKATMVQYVGETLRYLLSAPELPTDTEHNVRLVYGNGLRPDVWPVFQKRFAIPMVCEFYAATEGPGLMMNRSKNDFARGAVGRSGLIIRKLMAGGSTTVKFDHETNSAIRDAKTGFCIPVDENEPGELLYRLDEKDIKSTFQGYFGNKEATSKKILRDVLVKGDAYFSTGDLLRRDSEGRVWFVDRIGDTFRWRSENVSTAEVGEVVGLTPGVAEANIYGVLVPKHDGRAGCAAIILKDQESTATLTTSSSSPSPVPVPPESILTAIASQASKNLPKYAVPLFLRFTRAMDLTGTNKQQKATLREQGIQVDQIAKTGDRMYWMKDGRYVPFEESDLKMIESGGAKL
ncbi:putative long-chain fatty acid transporter [Pseudovirgaria hyperparasitica]|uniref:Very long-chain fatty acid transport protein n=1 Tax=Pseudovirgaria hyperparasitica TaxID=470096 RepID=A0A6A6VY79_9PEZI|nr:putative long-chain fatty acid transporter [Pseudovirgaria hyperparasitica]KAF2755213.1 putative long-chain fatty acid transporter [Pseudovirgaria hyperparasitica]